MKAVCYLRVSTPGQVEEGVSLAAQEERLRAWAVAIGGAEAIFFRDEGISGGRADNRPGLQAALAAIKPGDVLAVYALSRLSRSTCDLLDLAEEVRVRGADLMSLTEKIDTSGAAGKMIFRVLAVLCEFERDQVSERTKAALAWKRSRGEKTGGDVPFGYDAAGGRLTPNPMERATIQTMKRLRARGASYRAICRKLETAGRARKDGLAVWGPASVARILEREARA